MSLNSSNYQNLKRQYYRLLYQYSPDRTNKDSSQYIFQIFRQILLLYSLWRENPSHAELSPNNIKQDNNSKKFSEYLYDKSKQKISNQKDNNTEKKFNNEFKSESNNYTNDKSDKTESLIDTFQKDDTTYYCVNYNDRTVLMKEQDIEGVLINKVSKYLIQMLLDKKAISGDFVNTIYQLFGEPSELVKFITGISSNNNAINNFVSQLLQPLNRSSLIKHKYKPSIDPSVLQKLNRTILYIMSMYQ